MTRTRPRGSKRPLMACRGEREKHVPAVKEDVMLTGILGRSVWHIFEDPKECIGILDRLVGSAKTTA